MAGISRRQLIRRGAGVAGSLLFADILGIDRVLRARATGYQQPPYAYRSQFDGSYCCSINCGMAAGAMMRSTMSGQSKNPTGASVRMWWNHYHYGSNCVNGSYVQGCSTSDTCAGLGYHCPDNSTPVPNVYYALLNPEDGGGPYNVGYYNLSWTNFVNDMKPSGGYSGVVSGIESQVPASGKCTNFAGSHSVYVLGCDSTGSSFTVYDPDNEILPCSMPKTWSAATMQVFTAAYAGAGWVNLVLGRAN